ncbi:MAG: DUF1674 domain-containing protein [Panacagrimonas sp.]
MTDRVDRVVRRHRPLSAGTITLGELLAEQDNPPKNEEPAKTAAPGAVPEIGGRKNGLEPTRYGDWEKDGRCIDF